MLLPVYSANSPPNVMIWAIQAKYKNTIEEMHCKAKTSLMSLRYHTTFLLISSNNPPNNLNLNHIKKKYIYEDFVFHMFLWLFYKLIL